MIVLMENGKNDGIGFVWESEMLGEIKSKNLNDSGQCAIWVVNSIASFEFLRFGRCGGDSCMGCGLV